MMGHLKSFLASRGGNLNKNFAKNTNARGLPGGGGMLKLRFDGYITGKDITIPLRANPKQANPDLLELPKENDPRASIAV